MFKVEPPKVELPIKGLLDHNRAKGLCPTPLENAGRNGIYENGTMKPLFSASCFPPSYLYSTIQLISPSTTSAPFTLLVSLGAVLLFQRAIPLRPFSFHSCLHFPTFLNITISFCAWSKSPHLLFPPLWAQHPHGKCHSSDATGEVVAIVGWRWVSMYKKYFFHNANSAPEGKKRDFYSQLKGQFALSTLQILNLKHSANVTIISHGPFPIYLCVLFSFLTEFQGLMIVPKTGTAWYSLLPCGVCGWANET